MTQIEIPLPLKDNYISFPATSTDTLRDILISSGVKDNVSYFAKWDSIQNNFVDVDIGTSGTEQIEEGRGYLLRITSPGTIIYEGIEYSMTFDQFKSRIVTEWNLLGVGNNTIVPKSWCRILDPSTGQSPLPVTILEPKHAYWSYGNECIQPGSNIVTIIGITASSLIIYSLLKQFKVI